MYPAPGTGMAAQSSPGTGMAAVTSPGTGMAAASSPGTGMAAVTSPGTGPGVGVPVPHAPGVIAGEWPLQDALELGPLPDAVPCARLHARQVLWKWGLARLAASVELVISELVTNAVAAVRSAGQVSPVRLWLLADRTQVLILVWDASPRPPAPVNVGHDAENGRGLLLVDALSQRWDWYFPQHTGGKVVWALAGN